MAALLVSKAQLSQPRPGEARDAVLERLRDEIRRLERRPARREGTVPCGLPEVDAALGGGFRRGALTELAGGPASGKTAAALALVAALGPQDLTAWVDGPGELYPPAAAALGVDLGRLLLVRPGFPGGSTFDPVHPERSRRPGGEVEGLRLRGPPAPPSAARRGPTSAASLHEDPWMAGLWAGEALLASGAFAAVVLDVPISRAGLRGAETMSKRLQAAVEKGGAIGVWLAPRGASLRLPAAARVELGVGRARVGRGHAA